MIIGFDGMLHIDHGTISASHGLLIGTPERRSEIDSVLAGIPVDLREGFNEAQRDLADYTEQLLLEGHLSNLTVDEKNHLDTKR